MRDTVGNGASEHAYGEGMRVFQINHARIIEPKAGDDYYTKDKRLFPAVRVMDHTGALELRMREKTALELAGVDTKEDFAELASKGGLNFPLLSSMRISVRSKPMDTDGATEHTLLAVIVEVAEQELYIPKAMPNASMTFVSQLLASLPLDADRMIVAPVIDLRHVRHAGMVVETKEPKPLQASCVLSLIAHTGKSVVNDLPGGHKLVSKDCWNVPFEQPVDSEDGAPEHADHSVSGEIASYCTMNNVQNYTLTSRRSKEAVYALILISSVHEGQQCRTYMVDKVQIIDKPDHMPMLRCLLKKLAEISCASESSGKLNAAPDWREDVTPYAVKKARHLSCTPTDADWPES
jgi:hypothetical protein